MTGSRLRKVACEDCGYTIRVTRSWMDQGLPSCPCGGRMVPESGADLAYLGMIGIDDVPRRVWTEICRENGWEDLIIRKGAAAKTWTRRRAELRGCRADFCAHPSCGRWIKSGETHCPEHSGTPQLEEVPF